MNGPPMTPLGELIADVGRQFLDLHGVELSYGDIARRSRGRLTRQRVQQLAKDPVARLPLPPTIDGLAWGLAVPYTVVLERALASSGYQVPRGWSRNETSRAPAIDTEAGRLTALGRDLAEQLVSPPPDQPRARLSSVRSTVSPAPPDVPT